MREEGRLVREGGRLVREEGRLVREEGLPVREEGRLVREEGRLVREEGRLVREGGRLERDIGGIHQMFCVSWVDLVFGVDSEADPMGLGEVVFDGFTSPDVKVVEGLHLFLQLGSGDSFLGLEMFAPVLGFFHF